MAKTESQGIKFRDIMAAVKKGNFAPVYLLMGEEPYYIDQIVKAFWCISRLRSRKWIKEIK